MHVSPSTLSRQIQRPEEDLGQPLFVRDNRTVTLTEAGEELRTFAQQTLLQYQQLRHAIDQQGPSLSGELHIFLLRDRRLQSLAADSRSLSRRASLSRDKVIDRRRR